MSIKDRLDLIISRLGISGRALSKECGFSESYYSTINDGIGADKLNKILSKYPNISAQWLITGKGDMFKDAQEDTTLNTDDMTINKFLDALERRDRQIDEMLSQNSRMLKVIEQMQGISQSETRKSPPPRRTRVNTPNFDFLEKCIEDALKPEKVPRIS